MEALTYLLTAQPSVVPHHATAARLFSVHQAPPSAKILHLIRHAEGTHNVKREYRSPEQLDAVLTPRGVEQCQKIAERVAAKGLKVECIISSPMSRALQTAMHSFEPIWSKNHDDKINPSSKMIFAHEEWRETVNYICDVRRPIDTLRSVFPMVDFGNMRHDKGDPIWAYYEQQFGCDVTYAGHRESQDAEALQRRVREAWEVISQRPERSIAIVSHSAFFAHMFAPQYEELYGMVRYEDDGVRALMEPRFTNCELRTVAFEAP